MRTTKLVPILVVLTLLAGLIVFPVLAAPQLQGGNLLSDPSFDMAAQGNWKWAWWSHESIVMQSDNKKQPDLDQSFYAPNFAPDTQWNHGGEGGAAGKTDGRQYTKFRAGFYQSVDVPAGTRVQFSIWVNEICETGGQKCPVILKAGIDPNGGTDWQSGGIQWVGTEVANSKYVQLVSPEVTVGASGKVTVFTWGEPRYPMLYNAAYFDDAILTVTAAAPAVTPTKSAAPPTSPPPAAPPAPASCATLRWVSDVTVPDNTVMAPGQQFVKTWRVRNSGTCAFSGTLYFIGRGNQMGGQSPTALPKIDPGQQADVSINLTAPAQPGDYQGTWQPRMNDGTPMENLIIKIKVSADAPTPVPAVTATPQGQIPTPAASPTPTTGQICVQAYDDRNGNSQQEPEENLARGVAFTLSDAGGPRDSYTTDGMNEPFCWTNLEPGSYQVSVKPPANYSLTTNKTIIIAVNSGTKTEVLTGARRGGPAPTPTGAGSSSGGGATASSTLGSAARLLLIVVAVLVLVGLGFGGAFLLMSRRQ